MLLHGGGVFMSCAEMEKFASVPLSLPTVVLSVSFVRLVAVTTAPQGTNSGEVWRVRANRSLSGSRVFLRKTLTISEKMVYNKKCQRKLTEKGQD